MTCCVCFEEIDQWCNFSSCTHGREICVLCLAALFRGAFARFEGVPESFVTNSRLAAETFDTYMHLPEGATVDGEIPCPICRQQIHLDDFELARLSIALMESMPSHLRHLTLVDIRLMWLSDQVQAISGQ